MSTTIPALSSVTDILDSDLVMITHSNGESFKIAGSEINKRNQAVIASSTTVTGAPLKTGNIVRVYFTADVTGSNTTTGLVINYNNVNYSVKVPKNGTLANFVASDLGGSPTVYKYLQAHTTLELLYDGTQFIIIENPVVLSGSDFRIFADGSRVVNTIANNNMNAVTANAVYNYTVAQSTASKTVQADGTRTAVVDVSDLPENGIRKFKLFVVGNGNATHVAEGSIFRYRDGPVSLLIYNKSSQLTLSMTNDNKISITTTDYIYSGQYYQTTFGWWVVAP